MDEDTKQSKITTIIAKFNSGQKLLMDQYDEHMKTILPEPKMLPIRLNISIVRKEKSQINIENLF